MNEYREERTIVEGAPVGGAVVGTQYGSVVREEPGMSGGAVVALVLAAIAAAIVITILIMSGQRNDTADQLAEERARTAAAQQNQTQPQQQPPVIVTMPQSQPSAIPVPVPVPVPSQSVPTVTAPTSVEIEMDVTSKLLDDSDLRAYPIDVKVSGGTATLAGELPNDELKIRAERLAMTTKGVRNVRNNITVKP